MEKLRRIFSFSGKLSKRRKDLQTLQETGHVALSALLYAAPKRRFGEKPLSEREQVLTIAEILHKETGQAVDPRVLARKCLDGNIWTKGQRATFVFQAALRRVLAHLKSSDGSGLELWGQIPLRDENGALLWEKRSRMTLRDYAWQYVLRDKQLKGTAKKRDCWKKAALQHWTETEFLDEVAKLRAGRASGEAGEAA
jgi:hypothetical protein